MDKEKSLDELAARVKFGMMMNHLPGFAQATIAMMANTTDYRSTCERGLARIVLGRDPITTEDIVYDSNGRITKIGGQKVEGYTEGQMPAKVGGRKVVYGIFETPIGFE